MDDENAPAAPPAVGASQRYTLARYEAHIEGNASDAPPTEAAMYDVLDEMWAKWRLLSADEGTLERVIAAFGLETVADTGDMRFGTTNNMGQQKDFRGLKAVEAAYYKSMTPVASLFLNFVTADLTTSEHRLEGRRGPEDRRADTTYCRIYETITQCFILVRAEYRRRTQAIDDLYQAHAPGAESAASMVSRDDFQLAREEKLTSYQWLLLYCLFDIHQQQLRKLDGALYAEKMVPKYRRVLNEDGEPLCATCHQPRSAHPTTQRGRRRHAFTTMVEVVPGSEDSINTSAWEPFHETEQWKHHRLPNNDIETYLQLRCSRQGPGGRQVWNHFTSKANMVKDLAQQLAAGYDAELPVLRVDRAVWSCQNGVFDGNTGEFFEYASKDFLKRPNFVATKYIDLWYDWEAISTQMLGAPVRAPSRPPSARFAHVVERRFCAACGRQDLFHSASCRANAWELRCERCDGTLSSCRCAVCPTCGADEEEGCAEGCADAAWRGFFYPYERRDGNFMDIRTPWMDSILRFQELGDSAEEEREVWKWTFIMLGRLFFELNKAKNDDWQVCFFIKGQANTGKSTLADWLQRFLLPRQVAILSNNAQETFGMADLLNYDGSEKQLILCLECKGDFTLPQAALQSMITGESVSVSRKHERSKLVASWSAPLFLLGNELPGLDTKGGSSTYKDNSGSLSRRFVILEFAKELTDDQRYNCLGECLFYAEGFELLTKCLLAYGWAREQYRDVSTWGKDPRRGFRPIMPKFFHASREAMRAQSNSLVAFLETPATADEDLIYGQSFYILQSEFINMWKQKCSELGMRPTPWNADFYCTPFGRRHLRVEKKTLRYPPTGGKPKAAEYILGIGKRAFFETDEARQAQEGSAGAPRRRRRPRGGGRPARSSAARARRPSTSAACPSSSTPTSSAAARC